MNSPEVISPTSHAYPRPQLERDGWISLNGTWDFALDPQALYQGPDAVKWNTTIQVPYSPETAASGIHNTGFYKAVWYRKIFGTPALEPGERLILHFGAVDYAARVWVNGLLVATHRGGYTPFRADITHALRQNGPQEIIVQAEDDPADLAKPRGKQDWKLESHSIWYPRTTGIWQTVWLEVCPASFIDSLKWSAHLERWEIGIEAVIGGVVGEGMKLAVRMIVEPRPNAGGESEPVQLVASDVYSVVAGEVHRRIALSDPGIDDYRNGLLWSPASPTLIEVELELRDRDDRVIDSVRSYTALRSVAIQGDRFILNGRPLNLRLVLDQGYWPETGITAPGDDALLADIMLVKQMGFNGVRKHQKIEDPRFLFWADHAGLLVWEEMPSAYRYTRNSIDRLIREWIAVLERDSSHPCIVTWVPFNESWGVPDLPDSSAQRNYVQALYHLTKALDPSRPVIGNDGWESVATDIIGIHDYDDQPARIGKRYGQDELGALFNRERPGGRMLFVDGKASCGQPVMLTEFGGIALTDGRTNIWGYSQTSTAADFLVRYCALLETVRSIPSLAGFCYTQFSDTYQEANGLVYADRTPKAPLDQIALATTGAHSDFDTQQELIWREHMMAHQRRTRERVVPAATSA